MLLFMKGRTLAGFCRNKNIKSFMTSENYLPVADAVNLIGPHIGVHTLSYQYSNMSIVWPIMQSTAETMLVFSSMFIDRYKKDGIEARRYVKTGYVFDSSFDLVMDRAAEHKKNLYKRGANLIISYFNESIHNEYSKYGVIYKDDYYAEISALVKLVLDDKSVAVIIKPQFVSKTLSAIFPDDDLIMSGIATGRLIELHTGNHRNNVFPSEVAIASSIVIGHVIGATAGLESVLSGSRCILLNPNNMQGGNIDIFNRVDVLYENINLALDAINLFHRGDPKYSQLGVWDAIIDNFDPFRDGKSAGRLRKCIEESIG